MFERANEAWGFEGGDERTAAFSATWEGEAALPTLAYGNYVKLDEAGQQQGECHDNYLFRPHDDNYASSIALTPGLCTLSILFSDWSRSGTADLRVTNDRHYYRDGEEQLWRMAEGEVPRLYTRDDGWMKMQIWGMGIASHDVTGDGLPEVFLTSQGDNKLQALNEGPLQPTYTDIAIRRGATAHRPYLGDETLPSTAWHAEFDDVNNDGFADLYIAKGNVDAMPDFAAADPNNLLMGLPDGSFTEGAEAAGIVQFDRTRGAAVVDLNLDGMLDLVEVNRAEPARIWRNLGWGSNGESAPMGNWIAIQLQQPAPNRDAIGAWIEVRVGEHTMVREATVGGGHAGGQLGPIHFGLGDSGEAELRVLWPDGEVGPWLKVRSNEFVSVERGSAEIHTWVRPVG